MFKTPSSKFESFLLAFVNLKKLNISLQHTMLYALSYEQKSLPIYKQTTPSKLIIRDPKEEVNILVTLKFCVTSRMRTKS